MFHTQMCKNRIKPWRNTAGLRSIGMWTFKRTHLNEGSAVPARAQPARLPQAFLRFWVSQSPRPNKSHRSYSDLVLSLAEVNQKCCLTVTVCLLGIKAKPKARSCPHLFINSLFLTFLFSKPSWEGRPDITRQVARSLNTLRVKRREITSKNPSYFLRFWS